MTTTILKDIPFGLSAEPLKRRLRIREGEAYHIRFLALIEEAQKIARPKAMYCPVYIEDRTDVAVKVEGQWFRSRVLSVNLIHAHAHQHGDVLHAHPHQHIIAHDHKH